MEGISGSIRCPYCGSLDSQEVFRNDNMPTILYACERKNAALSEIRPFAVRLCFQCALCFNSTPLSEDTLELIYRMYRTIRPRSGLGASRYNAFIQTLQSYALKDDYLVEIGSSDGYLIDFLSDMGYSHLEGIEPSREWKGMRNSEKIRNCFFSSETSFVRPVDVFFLVHVLEHLPSLQDALSLMHRSLSDGGRVVFEVPYFTGLHHQHLIFFTSPFLRRLAQDFGFEIVEETIERNDMRVCLRKNDKSRLDNTRDAYCPLTSTSIEQIKGKFNDIKTQNSSTIKSLRQIFKENKRVFWWGTGITSVMALSMLEEELLNCKVIFFIDSDASRRGLFLPLPNLLGIPIKTPEECIYQIAQSDALVLASSFSDEILSVLKSKKITLPDSVYYISWR